LSLSRRYAKLIAVLSKLRPELAGTYACATFEAVVVSKHSSLWFLFETPARLRDTLLAWSAGVLALFGIYGLTGWLPTIMLSNGDSLLKSFSYTAAITGVQPLSGYAIGYVSDVLRSRTRAMVIWFLLAGIAVLILGLATSYVGRLALAAASGFFVFGGQVTLGN
jgi:MFS transporter, AAHS family, 4-hydroxybenzoate transporter